MFPFLLSAQGGNKGEGGNKGMFRAMLKMADSLLSVPKQEQDPFAEIPFDFDQKTIDSIAALYPKGTVHCNKNRPTLVVEVLNPITGRIWMDRNLGASRAAISVKDSMAFGDLYQWGRGPDGHQCRNSKTTTGKTSNDQPGHGDFILVKFQEPFPNWRTSVNHNLWQGVDGINNPCPEGFRIPTEFEWRTEVESWGSKTIEGGYASSLKLTAAGRRRKHLEFNGEILYDGSGIYLGSTFRKPYAMRKISHVYYTPNEMKSDIGLNPGFEILDGNSVRCIKDRSSK